MRFRVYLHDLRDEWIRRVHVVLREELADEIEVAVARGIDRESAASEIVDDYLNRHNVGWELEL